MTDPKHPEREQFDDPDSIPVLTDVIVPGRPSMPRRGESHETAPEPKAQAPTAPPQKAEAPAAPQSSGAPAQPAEGAAPRERKPTEDSIEATRAAQLNEFAEADKAGPTEPRATRRPHEPLQHGGAPEAVAPAEAASTPAAPVAREPGEPRGQREHEELSERDVDHIAERLRTRFAGYLRDEGRRVIEARCREALEEHTSWLVRQVTREVALVLEGEVVGWVRDAVREELAAHRAARR
ncbi:uncharacterized protein DUF2486 [Trinickia symbiotica]|uniref:DUF2486 family protein n=1 Tax=Trinickia symbiotica TaxID=863227 RepID=UPI000382ED9E|nr:DUF2486 family protein [Trinickia symbiotica]PPK45835.1 uncharacterized protein DUF2486 [Trinickia symbiotica]